MNRPSRDPSDNLPLNPPEPEGDDKVRELAGDRNLDDGSDPIDASEVDTLGQGNMTEVYEGELEGGENDRLLSEAENLETLTELELRDGETDDPMQAVEEGLTYVPPIDPPTVPDEDGSYGGAEIASGFGVSSLDEPYDADSHSDFQPDDDEMTARVREALRADSSTTEYAHRIAIAVSNGIVTLRGVVDDLDDSDNLLAVAGYVEGVEDVVDELNIKGIA